MTKCKANNCYNSPNYSWNDYYSYHERCLSKLREYENISNIQKIETFTTWFNGNCDWVVNYDYSSSSLNPYFIWIVVYEPAVKSMRENLKVIKHNNYPSLGTAAGVGWSIKLKLQNSGWYDTPMLKVHPETRNWKNFHWVITNPYVKVEEVGNWDSTHCILFVYGSGTTPSDLDRHFKPLDIVKIKEANKWFGTRHYHYGIYLGDVGNGKRICHFTSENNGVRLVGWNDFLKDRIGELYRYHPMIPFKYSRRIAEQIAWARDRNFREDNYDLTNRNCEHFTNMIVYGINYSEQIYNRSFLSGNNGKGSTIKLIDEMSESNGMLGERDNWLSDRIKANIEVPPKENCRIM